jgi:zinc transport system substrate-binding protein
VHTGFSEDGKREILSATRLEDPITEGHSIPFCSMRSYRLSSFSVMIRHRLLQITATAGLACVLQACSKPPAAPSGSDDTRSGPPVVTVVNAPLEYFAKRIGGDAVDVRFPAAGQGDPAFWQPGDDSVVAMQESDVILLNGATYSQWMDKVTLPKALLVDTSKAFSGEFIQIESAVSHSHGEGEEHTHHGIAFTTWMDFQQAVWQAEEVRDAMIALVPDQREAFQSRFTSLADDLDALHSEFKSLGKEIGDRPLVASHPVYQYFARRYGLNLESVHWEPETVPEDEAMAELKAVLEEHPAKWMLWEGTPAAGTVRKLQDLGIESVVVNPCGDRPQGGDWLGVMKQNAANLREIL